MAGVDEAGRGAWAGPLVAAAVIVPADPLQRSRLTRALRRAEVEIRDSKQLSTGQRARAAAVISEFGIPWSIAVVDVATIDDMGLGAANLHALTQSAVTLDPLPTHVLVDAFRLPGIGCECDAIVHGDEISYAIAMASILAKTYRDEAMTRLHLECPHYGFASHKGYGTSAHADALARHGISIHHRRSFAPIAAVVRNADPS